jgi:pimeloyl-ACP methyl ester carboxylesterase
VLLGPIPPFLLKTNDNSEGVNKTVFDGIMAAVVADRYALKDFLDNFYNVDKLPPARISDQARQASWNVGAGASAHAIVACVPTWLTDFRGDLPKIDVPTLVVQGTEDRILPIGSTGRVLRSSRMSGSWRSRKVRTTSAGLTPAESTRPCSIFSPTSCASLAGLGVGEGTQVRGLLQACAIPEAEVGIA